MTALPEPYWQDEARGLRLFHGDCHDLLPCFADGEFGSVVTDPPYGTGSWRRPEAHLGRNPSARHMREEWDCWNSDWFTEAFRVARSVLSFCPQTRLPEVFALREGWRLLVWGKPDPCPKPGKQVLWSFEPIVTWGSLRGGYVLDYAVVGAPKFGRDKWATEHPHEKPREVIEWLLGMVRHHGASVLDPYLGSGTTLAACAKLGIPGTGIEISEAYCEMAAVRLSEDLSYGEPNLFNVIADRAGVPTPAAK